MAAKRLIVNADDFGLTPGVNRGVLEAHRDGVVTSASLMVGTPHSRDAAESARDAPRLSLGLHADVADAADGEAAAELRRQVDRFVALVGRPPTHLDAHHNAHRDPRFREAFLGLARSLELPLRQDSPVRYFSRFYGRWGGESHPERIGVASLERMLASEVGPGITELGCHPGYADGTLRSDYALERETELRTLCDPAIRRALADLGIELVSYHDLPRLLATARGA